MSFVITIITLNNNDNQKNSNSENIDKTIIKLSDQTETYDIDDDLKIEFISNNLNSEDVTLYKANIYLKGNNIIRR